jgi:hypothetical protein
MVGYAIARYLDPTSTGDLARMSSGLPSLNARLLRVATLRVAALRHGAQRAPIVLAALVVLACAQPIPVRDPEPVAEPRAAAPTVVSRPRAVVRALPESAPTTNALTRWPIKTAAHVDGWLHAFAMIQEDTVRVPLFRRGYRDSLIVVKNRANLVTALDSNYQLLMKRLLYTPSYQNAQFLALQFANWEQMYAAAEQLLDGPRRSTATSNEGGRGGRIGTFGGPDRSGTANDSEESRAQGAAAFGAIFRTAEDKLWLRMFVNGVNDEQRRFFAREHARLERSRSAVVTAVDSLWQREYRARFERFLANTGQRNGDLLLSMPIGGEGRVGVGRERQTVMVLPFPARVEDARDAVLVFAHEAVAGVTSSVLSENLTAADQRAGTVERLLPLAQVRAGAMLLDRVAPDLTAPYMTFYLLQAGAKSDMPGLVADFQRTFDVPSAVRDGLQRQIDAAVRGL